MTINKGLFTSDKNDWGTPIEIFDPLNKEFKFDLDVCATHKNKKCEKYFTQDDDGLLQEWGGACWMNPPYGREISKWMKKAYDHHLNGGTVVCLVPARTDTRWWHDYVMKANEVRFIKGRIKFLDSEGEQRQPAPFPSAIVIYKGTK